MIWIGSRIRTYKSELRSTYGLIKAYIITQQTSYVRLAGERGRSCMVILYGIFAAFGL